MSSVYIFTLDTYAGGEEDGGLGASEFGMEVSVLLTKQERRFLLFLIFGYQQNEVLEKMRISNRQYYAIKNRIAAKLIDAGLVEDTYLREIKEILREKGVSL